MDPVSALKTGSEAISLVSAFAKLVKLRTSSEPNSSLPAILARLQVEAVRLSRDLENRIRALIQNLHEYGLNPAMSIDQQLTGLSWYNFASRSRIKTFREECLAVYRQLTAFMDDVTAILVCENRAQAAASAFAASLETKRQLDELFMRADVPLRTILEGLLATAGRVSAELHSA